ncbi:Uncharacterised protein [Salmonella enterica subsp. enterica serovar Bovismorbificans]|nr:Uncharacterised protein [Salmonella enterica subsp. enterica serovar Bovismorbificans]
MLRTFVLAFHHDAGRQVGNTDSGVGGVNVLTARAGRTKRINAQIRRVNIRQLGFRQLRHHGDGTGGGMDTPLRLGRRNTLYAVSAGLKFQPAIHAVAADFGDDLFITAMLAFAHAHDLHAPAARFGITAVHAEQIAGKQRGFVAAGAGANLKERVSFIVRIFRQQQYL